MRDEEEEGTEMEGEVMWARVEDSGMGGVWNAVDKGEAKWNELTVWRSIS